jgi:hypothetical protein
MRYRINTFTESRRGTYTATCGALEPTNGHVNGDLFYYLLDKEESYL